jgi:uncharacterized membrane protein YhdT
MFWSVYAVDRELVFPQVIDAYFPVWLNHSCHTAPLLFILIENLFVPKLYPSRLVGAVSTFGGICTYLLWFVEACKQLFLLRVVHTTYNCLTFISVSGIKIYNGFFKGSAGLIMSQTFGLIQSCKF